MLAWNSLRRPASRFAAACLVFVILAGCSADRSVFESTPFRPARVEVIDTLNRETVWAMDVPVHHKLVVDMEHEGSKNLEGFRTSEQAPQYMKWQLYPAKARKRFAVGYYWASPLEEGVVELNRDAVMLRYSIIPREDDVPTGPPPESAPPAPRPVEPPPDARDADEQTGEEMDPATPSEAGDEPMQ